MRTIELGIVTDEVARDVPEALAVASAWGLRRFELREGSEARFPAFTAPDVRAVEDARAAGARITAVSPGIFKGSVEDRDSLVRERDRVLPRAIEMASRFEAPVLIAFAFERTEGETDHNRLHVLRALEALAEAASEAGLTVALENEPAFWIDRPEASVALLEEIGHPALRLNWDPANLHWGGMLPDYEAFARLQPYLANVHLKDFAPDDPAAPWRPLGRGITPWEDLMAWLVGESDLGSLTIETHCEPLLACSEESLETARVLLDRALRTVRADASNA